MINENEEGIKGEDDLDDFEELGLFHKSSLKESSDPPLPEVAAESHGVKRWTDEEKNIRMIGQYLELEEIGSGAFATVVKAECKNSLFAIKIYSLLKLRSQRFFAADGSFANGEQMFHNEINIIKRLNHPNIIKTHEIMYSSNYVFVVNDLCDLGQIMKWDEKKQNYTHNSAVIQYIGAKYSLKTLEEITAMIFLQASRGLKYLHDHNITNRDVKVDNILCLKSVGQGDEIKIADFTTVRYSNDDISYFVSGTPGFRCPEQQNASMDGYSCKSGDIWSLGISMYTFYCEYFPFMGETEMEIDLKAQNEELKFPEHCPVALKDLISQMTHKNWKTRINIQQVIEAFMNMKL